MTKKAFVLVLADPDKTTAVRDRLKAVPGVSEVQQLAGPYDMVAFIDIPQSAGVSSAISRKIRAIEGVASTTTCVAVPEGELAAG